MILVAAYIIEHYLFEKPQAINFVGNYYYNFELEYKKININRVKNDNYVENLYSNNISELSAIVGANGSGKTTLFSIINKHYDTTRAIFIYEDAEHNIKLVNRTGQVNENGNFTEKNQISVFFEGEKIDATVNIDIPTLYYSPIPDQDLNNFSSSVSKTSHFKSTLAEYHLDNIERSIMLLSDDIAEQIKSIYPKLPLYNHISILAKPLYKKDLRNTYGGFKVTGDIEKAQKEALEKLWESYPTAAENRDHLTHDSYDFFKNIEVNILSYLLIDGTSIQTAFNGKYPISYYEIIKEKDFEKKLKHLFFHRIAYLDKYIYSTLKEVMIDKDYHMLLFQFENTNFDELLKEKQGRVISAIHSLKESFEDIDEKYLYSYINGALESLIVSELNDEEFESITHNILTFNRYLGEKIQDNKDDLLQVIKKGLEEVEVGIGKSFDGIFEVRFEIIGQLKEGAKKTIKLFKAIQDFYNFTKEFTQNEGVVIEGGEINVNLTIIDFSIFKDLMKSYRVLLEEFNGNSLINAQILEFRPDKRLSYGEKSLLNLFSSFYEFTIRKHHFYRRKEHYIVLLDEADLGFHPLWKKKFVSAITKVLPIIFNKMNDDVDNSKTPELNSRKIQIIFSTHDPLTLSDIPNYNIVYVDKIKNDKSDIVHILENHLKPKQSFGANVHDLLANSFFLEDGFMGEFSEDMIGDLADYLVLKADPEGRDAIDELILKYEWSKKRARQIINIVDEPLIKERLNELFDKKYLFRDKQALILKRQEIDNRLKEIEDEED